MAADGVDFSYPSAAQAWIDDFNARPFDQQAERFDGAMGTRRSE